MSKENVEAAQRAYDAFNRRDLDAFLAVFDPEVDYTARIVEMSGSHHGHAGVRQWWDDMLSVFPDLSIEVVGLRDLGDVVITNARGRGHGVGSDAPFEESLWQVSRWRNGKVVSVHAYRSEAEALEAAGLLQ